MNSLKNMVVLRNLPSNIIDEAFLILKPNQKNKKLKFVPNQTVVKSADSNDYVIKEAEMIINSYLSQNDNSKEKELIELKKKNKQLKMISVLCFGLSCIATFINLFIV